MKPTVAGALLGLVLLSPLSRGADPLDPGAFDKDGDQKLSVEELTIYVIKRDGLKPDVDVLMPHELRLKPDTEKLILDDLCGKAFYKVGEIYAKLGVQDRDPVSVDSVRQLERPDENGKNDKDLKIPGFFGESKKLAAGSLGPFLLRGNADGWDKDLKKAPGAKVSYSHNRESDKTAWSSEGALIYPLSLSSDSTAYDRESRIRSERWLLLPSVQWKVNKTAQTERGDIEELQGQIPVVWSANHVNLGWLRNSEVTLMPFVLTDFSCQGLVWGLSASYSPYVFDDQSGFGLNTGYKGLGSSPLMYRLGLVPAVDYSHLSQTSRFLNRNGHDHYFRGGVKAEIGLITRGYPALETLASYQALAGISGAPDYSDLLSLSAKLWLNPYAGFTAEYQLGNTPVAQKDINLFTLGLEFRF